MRLYLGGPMFDLPNVRFNLELTRQLRENGYEVYSPNENGSINDKTRGDITPEAVYQSDLEELLESNVFVCQVAEDSGTMWEAGLMDCLSSRVNPDKYYGVIGLATDIRLATPPNSSQAGVNNQAWAINAFVIGGLKGSLGVVNSVEDLISSLAHIRATREGSATHA